jgi:hypothetical protein
MKEKRIPDEIDQLLTVASDGSENVKYLEYRGDGDFTISLNDLNRARKLGREMSWGLSGEVTEDVDFGEIIRKSFGRKNPFETIETFEKYLLQRTRNPEKPYGRFNEDTLVCRFFDSKDGENILADIKQKNEETGGGNIKIPNTGIMLINYSFCPQCKTIYSFHEIFSYYMNPKPDARYENRVQQYREDTRIFCGNCGAGFIPALVIADGTPRSEVQFLCRAQTINAVEEYFFKKNIRVLTKNLNNIILKKNGFKAIKNDVLLKNLEERPTLITNLLQYTPMRIMMNFIDGTNVTKGDLLFTSRRQ